MFVAPLLDLARCISLFSYGTSKVVRRPLWLVTGRYERDAFMDRGPVNEVGEGQIRLTAGRLSL